MSESGSLYHVSGLEIEPFKKLEDVSDWYESISGFGLEDADTIDLEQCWSLWLVALKNETFPLNKLFKGDLFFETDDDSPSIGLTSKETVQKISDALNENGQDYFLQLLNKTGFNGDSEIWVLPELKIFYFKAAEKGSAIVSLL